MKVSKREALLLFILAFIGIVGLMTAFVILPMMKTISDNEFVLADLETKKLVVDTQIPNLANYEKNLSIRLEEVSDALHYVEAPLNEAEFEQWILPLTTKYNMKILETNFIEPSIVVPTALDTIPTEQYYEIRTLVEEYNQINPEETNLPVTEAMLLVSSHEYILETTYARYVYLLDEVSKWDTTIYLNSSYYDFEEKTANLKFEVYTLHQLLPDDIEKDYTKDITAGGTGTGKPGEDPHPEGGK